MSDLFVSVVAIIPAASKLSGRQAERAPGISPSMKEGIWAERALSPTGVAHPYPVQSTLNAVVVP